MVRFVYTAIQQQWRLVASNAHRTSHRPLRQGMYSAVYEISESHYAKVSNRFMAKMWESVVDKASSTI